MLNYFQLATLAILMSLADPPHLEIFPQDAMV